MNPYNTIDRYAKAGPRDLHSEHVANVALAKTPGTPRPYYRYAEKAKRRTRIHSRAEYIIGTLGGLSLILVVVLTTAVLMGY